MIGHITDGLGMLRAIEERGVETHQADVLILGGGGTARVAGYAFLSRGGRVTFAVRDAQRSNALVHALHKRSRTDCIGFPFGRLQIAPRRTIF